MKRTKGLVIGALAVILGIISICAGDVSKLFPASKFRASSPAELAQNEFKSKNAAAFRALQDSIKQNQVAYVGKLKTILGKMASSDPDADNVKEEIKIYEESIFSPDELPIKTKTTKTDKQTAEMDKLEKSLYGTSWRWVDVSGNQFGVTTFEKPQPICRTPWGDGISLWKVNSDGTVSLSGDRVHFTGTLDDNIIRFSPDGKSFQCIRSDGIRFTATLIETRK